MISYLELGIIGLRSAMMTLDEELAEIEGYLETERFDDVRAGLEPRAADLRAERRRLEATRIELET